MLKPSLCLVPLALVLTGCGHPTQENHGGAPTLADQCASAVARYGAQESAEGGVQNDAGQSDAAQWRALRSPTNADAVKLLRKQVDEITAPELRTRVKPVRAALDDMVAQLDHGTLGRYRAASGRLNAAENDLVSGPCEAALN